MGFFKTLLGSALLVSSLAPVALGQSPVYGQCGGQGWTGSKSCVSGSCCTVSNAFYSQCLPGSCGGAMTTRTTQGGSQPTTAAPTSAPTSNPGTGPGSSGCGKGASLTTGAKTITVNGKQRQYTMRVPNNYNPNNRYRLIIGLHYRGGTMQDIATGLTPTPNVWNYYGLQKLAGESAIFVAPQGFGNGWGNSGGEDIAFMDAIIDQVSAGLCVNPRLIFATGFSYGGAMSYSIACSRATKFRAVAVIAGATLSGCSGGNDPIAYLGMHGIQDNVLNISGGRQLRDRFVKNNGCTSQSPPEVVRGSLSHKKTVYSGCRSGYPVWWIASDSNHSAAPADGTVGENKATTWAPVETWAFFSQFS